MDAASQAHEFSAVALTMAGVLARMAGAVGLSTLPIFPGLSIRIRLALVAALAVVAIPTAITAAGSAAVPSCPVPFLILGELMVRGRGVFSVAFQDSRGPMILIQQARPKQPAWRGWRGGSA